jgi:TRAP-type C4-dicarboxylate transport system permease large subunit
LRKKNKNLPQSEVYSLTEKLKITWHSLGVLFLPVIILGGIYSGVFTPTEASVIAVLYSLILGIAFREITVKTFIASCQKTVMAGAAIMMIVGVSNLFGWLLATTGPRSLSPPPFLSVHQNPGILYGDADGSSVCRRRGYGRCAPNLDSGGQSLSRWGWNLASTTFIWALCAYQSGHRMMTPPFGINLFTAVSVWASRITRCKAHCPVYHYFDSSGLSFRTCTGYRIVPSNLLRN